MRKSYLAYTALLAVLAATPVFAQSADQAAPAAQGASEVSSQMPAEKFVQDLGNQAIAVAADKSLSRDQQSQKYQALLQNAFDMGTIAKFVLGRAWAAATPEKQQEFVQLFDKVVIKIYSDRLSFYNGEKFVVKSFRAESDKDVVVNSEIDHQQGAPTTVDWRLRMDNGGYKIVDVSIEGISQSVTQRQEYASILQANGGNLDGLMDKMRQSLQQPVTQ